MGDSHLRQALAAREQFLNDGTLPTDSIVSDLVASSWRRSSVVGVDPEHPNMDFKEVHNDTLLLRSANPVLDKLQDRVTGSPLCILLADSDGRVVKRWAIDKSLAARLDAVRADRGFSWSEEQAATTGLGTVVEVGRPVLIVGSEHYAEPFKWSTCAGAPIFHPITRRIEGIVTISTRYEHTNSLLLPTAIDAASAIGDRLIEGTSSDQRALVAAFNHANRQRGRMVVAINERTVIATRAASGLLDQIDREIVWDQVSRLVASGQNHGQITFADRTHEARIERIQDGPGNAGVLLEFLQGPEKAERQPLRRASVQSDIGLVGCSTLWKEVQDRAVSSASNERVTLLRGEPGVGKRAVFEAVADSAGSNMAVIDCETANAQPDGKVFEHELSRALRDPDQCVALLHVEMLNASMLASLSHLLCIRRERVWGTARVSRFDERETDRQFRAVIDCDVIDVPPLRARPEDVRELAVHHLRAIDPTGSRHLGFDVLRILEGLPWGGNVRELNEVVEELAQSRSCGAIAATDLPARLRKRVWRPNLNMIERAERDLVLDALASCENNKLEAARRLGIARSTLYRKLRHLGIE